MDNDQCYQNQEILLDIVLLYKQCTFLSASIKYYHE